MAAGPKTQPSKRKPTLLSLNSIASFLLLTDSTLKNRNEISSIKRCSVRANKTTGLLIKFYQVCHSTNSKKGTD